MSSKTPLGRIRATVAKRANGECECCGVWVGLGGDLGHLDHFFGRKHLAEAVSNCWMLCPHCDEAKTANRPSASWWLVRFSEHCSRHGYDAEWHRAAARLQVLSVKFPDVA